MEDTSLDFILKVALLVSAVVTAFVTARTTLSHYGKKQDEHGKKLDDNSKDIETLKLNVASKISRDHAYEHFVTKEELKLNLENISIKQDGMNQKQDQIISILRDKK